MEPPVLHALSALDWAVVGVVLVTTTLIGARLGRHGSLREFFLGGRRLPWPVVAASIIATEISAATMVAIPWIVFRPGGDFRFFQVFLIGTVAARLVIAWKLVPLYFEREVYSPYDVVGARLGEGARRVASALFVAGSVLSQGARVYLTAIVLEVVLHAELRAISATMGVESFQLSVAVVALFAIGWTWLGGVATVAWTDLILLVVFLASALALLGFIASGLDTGLARIWQVGSDSGRFRFFDFDAHPARAWTFWAAALASSFGNVGAYGADQMIAQRLLCCRDARSARKAIVASSLAMAVTWLVALGGVALAAWYERNPMSEAGAELIAAADDRIVPVFVMEYLPAGLRGLVIAGILAAAISTLDGALGALAQTVVSGAWLPWRRHRRPVPPDAAAEERVALRVSRVLVLAFGVLLGTIGILIRPWAERYDTVLEVALAVPGFTQGALLAGVLLVLTRAPVDGSGYVWAAPLSALWVFASAFHGARAQAVVLALVAAALAAWLALRVLPDLRRGSSARALAGPTFLVLGAAGAIVWVSRNGGFWLPALPGDPGRWLGLAWPWYVPAGCAFAFVFGHLLARDRRAHALAPIR